MKFPFKMRNPLLFLNSYLAVNFYFLVISLNYLISLIHGILPWLVPYKVARHKRPYWLVVFPLDECYFVSEVKSSLK